MLLHSPYPLIRIQMIDAHLHLWHYNPNEYAWIDDSMQPLRRDFLVEELVSNMTTAGVTAGIAVQARQTVEETQWLLEVANHRSALAGVVGWLPIASHSFAEELQRACENPLLKGLRHIAQAEPEGFLLRPAFLNGIRSLLPTGLSYDILIHHRQLEETIAFVDRNPEQVFVLDHLAKPPIAAGETASWATRILRLAERENVYAKVSGLVTEADWKHWTDEDLLPYLDIALEAFGPSRLMAGSDWPVCTLGVSYTRWWGLLNQWVAPLCTAEQEQILSRTAQIAYRLTDLGEESA
jgi:L-fuconolactonase